MGTENRIPSRLGRTPTLGAMVDWIGDPYQCGILSGLIDGAQAAGATFLCFIGDSLPIDPQADARHRTFDLISRSTVDGLVVLASTLTHHVGISGLAGYCSEHFRDLPFCSIGEPLPDVPSVTTSNASGIQNILRHLISVHGHRRIAFVRGPLAHDEGEKRFAAYVSTLAEHGIEYDDRLVAVGTFMAESGHAAVQQFARIPGIRLDNLDAIVCSNDGMAIGVLRALEERGIAVPGTIAITGFDDVDHASFATPPLTTVRQALPKLGRQAARNVLEWAQLGTKPRSEEVNTELVIRRSCGCAEHSGQTRRSVAPELNCGFESALLMRRQHVLDSLSRAARGELGTSGKDWQAKLLNAFLADLGSDLPTELPRFIEEMTEKLLLHGTDVRPCRDVIDCLRSQLIVTLRGDAIRRERAEEIFYAAHLGIGRVVSRGMIRERANLAGMVRSISVTCNELGRVPDLSQLRLVIGTRLPNLGLHNYYIVKYRDQDPQQAELFMAHDRVHIDLSSSANTFDSSLLLPGSLLPALSGRAFAVLPLAVRELFLGHMLLELDLFNSYSYDSIADAIASGLHRSQLSQANNG